DADAIVARAAKSGINLRLLGKDAISISLDETTTEKEINAICELFGAERQSSSNRNSKIENRKSDFLTHPVFNTHHSETEMLRYIKRLESRDLSLANSMIPLGSCTMKLNATSEMLPVTWPEFSRIHPFAPADQTRGYQQVYKDLESWLAQITGFAAVSLQPNAGSQGEYAGLLAIRAYHASRGETHGKVCIIPTSAHGTNPASAVMAGFRVVAVRCLEDGDIDLADLSAYDAEHNKNLAALMG